MGRSISSSRVSSPYCISIMGKQGLSVLFTIWVPLICFYMIIILFKCNVCKVIWITRTILYFTFAFTYKPYLTSFKVTLITYTFPWLNYQLLNFYKFILEQITIFAPNSSSSWDIAIPLVSNCYCLIVGNLQLQTQIQRLQQSFLECYLLFYHLRCKDNFCMFICLLGHFSDHRLLDRLYHQNPKHYLPCPLFLEFLPSLGRT